MRVLRTCRLRNATQRYSGTLIKERGEEEISLKKIGSFPKLLMITLNREGLDPVLKQ
jgi:hypothetical protein